ncbi:putative acyl-CoA thioester hydrolase [compost metagenome]
MNLEQRIELSRSRVFKAIFPGQTNHYETLFGGVALQWMDEVAFIAATRFTRERIVTVSSDRVNFKVPIPAGSLIELDAQVVKVGTSSIEVRVDVYKEDMYREFRELAMSGSFTMVAVDQELKPVKIGTTVRAS